MLIAHLADPHLGFRQYHRLTERGLNQREADVGTAFVRAVDGVISARPDAVIIAGDIFHQVRPTNSAILLAMRQFSRLRRELPAAPIIVIAGNHDTPRSTDTVSIFGVLNELGIDVAAHSPRRFTFPELDLSVLAIPHQALFEQPRPAMETSGGERHQVLVLHGETPGLFGTDRSASEAGGAMLTNEDLTASDWSYVALGHYHVQHKVRERVWFAGALDYVSPNPWGELRDERRSGAEGKGWLLVDLEKNEVRAVPIEPSRRVLDLPRLEGRDLSAPELDRLLAEAVAGVPGGIKQAVVRQVVIDVPRTVARELDHAVIRSWKAEALHFQLDLRRPEAGRHQVGSGAPGSTQSLDEVVADYLTSRPLPKGMSREKFLSEGLAAMADVDEGEG